MLLLKVHAGRQYPFLAVSDARAGLRLIDALAMQ
jgi:hypothetical protein